MVDGKAMIDLRNLNRCNLDGECVDVCPTDVVTLGFQELPPSEPVAVPVNGNGALDTTPEGIDELENDD